MSKIEIVNRALMKLGEPPISSLNDVVFGKSYEIIYDDVKKLLLSIYPWRFAIDVKKLNRLDEKKKDKFVYSLRQHHKSKQDNSPLGTTNHTITNNYFLDLRQCHANKCFFEC